MDYPFIYRRATADDSFQLKALALDAYGQYEAVLATDQWQKMKAFLQDHQTFSDLLHHTTGFVCETAEKKIIGMVYFVSSSHPTEIFLPEWCYIRLLGIHPDFRRKGIAKQLIVTCIDHARATGEKVMALHTAEFMDEAHHLYKRFGFVRLREIDQRYGKRYGLYTLTIL